jgi:16S rRNA (guanine966-N2)-methyltransferase
MRSRGIRVSSGAFKGRQLEVPDGIRPTEQKVREALFSIWGERTAEAELLDLFAGTGAVGIEAASRGALTVTLVESDRRVLAALKRNAALLPAGSFRLLALPVDRALAELRERGVEFDLVFADPPYSWVPVIDFFAGCSALLRPGGALAVEHSARVVLPLETAQLVRTGTRRYGESALTFFGMSPS